MRGLAEGARRTSTTRWTVLAFAATFLIGLAHAHFPFMGDQALFSVFGRMIDDGAVLYEDVWDVKQPGIFVFYALAGRFFGFTEVGVHMVELAYLMGFSGVLWWLLRDRYRNPWPRTLIPVAVVGWYYAVSPIDYLTQVEALVGPLLFGTAWLTWRGGAFRYIWAGVLGGLVLFFKLALFPVVGALWLVALHESGGIRRRGPRAVGFLAGGLAVVALPWLIYLIANGLVGRVWWTYVTYPPEVLGLAGRTLDRLIGSVGQFGVRFLPLFALAAWGLWVGRRDSPARLWGVWIGAGFFTFVMQLWWGYLLLIIVTPLALLALDGLDDLLSRDIAFRRVGGIIVGLTMLPAVGLLGIKGLDLVEHGFGLGDSRAEFQAAVSDDYRTIREDLAALEPLSDGPIYVIGNPLYLYLAGSDQAVAITGWSPEFWTERLWGEVREGLRTARPVLLLVDDISAELAEERSPKTIELIDSVFEVKQNSSRDGVWYRPR